MKVSVAAPVWGSTVTTSLAPVTARSAVLNVAGSTGSESVTVKSTMPSLSTPVSPSKRATEAAPGPVVSRVNVIEAGSDTLPTKSIWRT